jgi:cytochrome c oxidase subunit 3
MNAVCVLLRFLKEVKMVKVIDAALLHSVIFDFIFSSILSLLFMLTSSFSFDHLLILGLLVAYGIILSSLLSLFMICEALKMFILEMEISIFGLSFYLLAIQISFYELSIFGFNCPFLSVGIYICFIGAQLIFLSSLNSLRSFDNLIFDLYLSIIFILWIRDLNREIIFYPESLILPLFILVLTEFILFLSYFWGYFNFVYFGVFVEALIIFFIFISSSYESFILSLGSLFGGYILTYTVFIFILGILCLLFQAIYFFKIQTYEFRFMGFLSLDSILGSVFFYLTALHLFHLYAALFLIFIFMGLSYEVIYYCLFFWAKLFIFILFLDNLLLGATLIIPPRWIEIATGNLYFWYSLLSIFNVEFCMFTYSALIYLHFVFIIWMVIDFSLNL